VVISFGVDVKTTRRRIALGRLTAYRVGPRLIRVDRASILKLASPIWRCGAVTTYIDSEGNEIGSPRLHAAIQRPAIPVDVCLGTIVRLKVRQYA
jgi:hypothetical protein